MNRNAQSIRLDAARRRIFVARLRAWFKRNGRDLPWRQSRDGYEVLVSELMLQQTQVSRVLDYYQRFLERFPTLRHVARARPAQVMEAWEGLGYYARARNLRRLAGQLTDRGRLNATIPQDPAVLRRLPGIGPYTAAAVASFAYERRAAPIDTNVARVLQRAFAPRTKRLTAGSRRQLQEIADALLPRSGKSAWIHNQALMELGALVCTARTAHCSVCPVNGVCASSTTSGTKRLVRGFAQRPKGEIPTTCRAGDEYPSLRDANRLKPLEVRARLADARTGVCHMSPSATLEMPEKTAEKTAPPSKAAAPTDGQLKEIGSLSVSDSRNNKSYAMKVLRGGPEGDTVVRAMDLRQIKTAPEEFGLMTYDPAFMNTASCKSAITFIDGDKGILRYRGYPIEQLAEKSTFLEVAWLLRNGELPTQKEYESWVHDITYHTYVHENIKSFLQGFRYDAHPMSMLCSAVAALSSFYPEAKAIHDPNQRNISIIRLLAKVPTLAAFCYRHVKGLPFIYPDNDLSYVENFLSMIARMSEPKYEGNPVFVKALEILFILHADHEQNCSTNAVRAVGSSHVDPFSAIAAGVAALYGPLHGGANEQVLRMINEIGHPKNVPAFIDEVKSGKGSRLMGFGHRVYKSYDPRAKIVKKLADEVFAQIGMDKDLEIALELERIALSDDYFVSRKLYPNVDFYTGLIYRSMAFPMDFFTVLFAVARTAGWLAQWEEMLNDNEQKIARPRQIYVGYGERPFKSKLSDRFPKVGKLALPAAH